MIHRHGNFKLIVGLKPRSGLDVWLRLPICLDSVFCIVLLLVLDWVPCRTILINATTH